MEDLKEGKNFKFLKFKKCWVVSLDGIIIDILFSKKLLDECSYPTKGKGLRKFEITQSEMPPLVLASKYHDFMGDEPWGVGVVKSLLSDECHNRFILSGYYFDEYDKFCYGEDIRVYKHAIHVTFEECCYLLKTKDEIERRRCKLRVVLREFRKGNYL